MKVFIALCLVAAAVSEPPRLRPARFRPIRFQRQELAPTTTDAPSTTEAEGPYPPSGWKPAGEAFQLPKDVEPASTYGPPEQSGSYPASGWKPAGEPFQLPNELTPPGTSYGVPDNTYGVPTTDVPTTPEPTDSPQAEKLDGPVDVQKSVGTYYVLLPDGQLQRVEFVTQKDVQNMRYTARLQLRDRAPLLLFRQ